MSDQEYIVGKCRQCSEELRVPARLETFSCMYCGARLTPEDLITEEPPEKSVQDVDLVMERIKTRIIHCILDHPGINQRITRREYDPSFEEYTRACRPVFDDLNQVCRQDPSRQTERIEEAAASFLDQLEQYWSQQKGWNNKMKRAQILDNDKLTVAIYLVPMVDYLDLAISKEFCQTLQKMWVERYPKSPFYLGTYEDIAAGFRKKFKFCFITTAVCEELGKPDDCEELTAFRAFRDGYLAACADGPALIEEYYDIAPGIVTCINLCGDRGERYAAIRSQYLNPCYEDLRAGRLEACKRRYTEMVRDLQKQYLS